MWCISSESDWKKKKKKEKNEEEAIVTCLTTFGWGCFIISIKTQFLVHLWNMKNTHPLLMKQNMVFGRALSNIVKVVIMAFLIFSIKFKPLEAARPLNVIMKSKHGATKLSIPYDRALVPPSRDPCTYIPAQCLPYLKKTELYLWWYI